MKECINQFDFIAILSFDWKKWEMLKKKERKKKEEITDKRLKIAQYERMDQQIFVMSSELS